MAKRRDFDGGFEAGERAARREYNRNARRVSKEALAFKAGKAAEKRRLVKEDFEVRALRYGGRRWLVWLEDLFSDSVSREKRRQDKLDFDLRAAQYGGRRWVVWLEDLFSGDIPGPSGPRRRRRGGRGGGWFDL